MESKIVKGLLKFTGGLVPIIDFDLYLDQIVLIGDTEHNLVLSNEFDVMNLPQHIDIKAGNRLCRINPSRGGLR